MIRKGQITTFIIIGILLLVAVSFFFFIRTKISQDGLALEAEKEIAVNEARMLQNFVESCLEQVTLDGVRIISRNGGYYRIPSREPFLDDALYPYHMWNGNLYPVTREFVTEELKGYIDSNLPRCTNAPEVFATYGFDVEAEPYTLDVVMGDNDLRVSLHYPLTLRRGERSEKIENFMYQSPRLPLGAIIDASQAYLEEQEIFPFDFCYTCLFGAFDENEIVARIEAIPVTNFTWVIRIQDDTVIIKGKPYLFEFAIKVLDSCSPVARLFGEVCPRDILNITGVEV